MKQLYQVRSTVDAESTMHHSKYLLLDMPLVVDIRSEWRFRVADQVSSCGGGSGVQPLGIR